MRKQKFLSFLLAFILLFSSLLPTGNGIVKAQEIDSLSNEILSEEKTKDSKSSEEKSEDSNKKKNSEEQEKKLVDKEEEKADSLEKEIAPKIDEDIEVSESLEEQTSDRSKDLILLADPEEATNYTSKILFPRGNPSSYYGGEAIDLYSQVEISGNTNSLEEGSYTLIYLPKDKYVQPVETDVTTPFDSFKELSISENSTHYIIKTTYQTLPGGYNVAAPVKVRLLPGQTVNASESTIKQEFYDVNNNKLSESALDVQGMASIETASDNYYSNQNIRSKVDENFIVKDGTSYEFPPSSVTTPPENHRDPRVRRVSVKIPTGLSLVDPNNTWTYDSESDSYYKDISRDQVNKANLTATLDLGGLDLTDHPSSGNAKNVILNFSLSVVEDGVVQDDITPVTWTSKRYFYAPKEEPSPSATINSRREPTLIDSNYTYLGSGRSVYLPYDESLLPDFRINFNHLAISYFSFNNSNDENDPKLTITSTTTDVTGYTYPSELRINLKTSSLTEEEIQSFTAKLQGTKAYGVKYDGSKELLTESVPIVYNGEGEYFSFEGSDYKTIEFEYPNGGFTFNNKAEINKYKNVLATDVVADFRAEAIQDLKNKLDNNQKPRLSYNENAAGFSNFDDKSRTRCKLTYKKASTDIEPTTSSKIVNADSDTYKYLKYNEIVQLNPLTISNGASFNPGNTIETTLSYKHTRNGDSDSAVMPENANLYYLVPDGLEPVENPEVFSQIRMISGYQEGYNLVIAKPKETKIPTGSSLVSNEQNDYKLSFNISDRLDVGNYSLHAALVIDNNKIEVINQQAYGILQHDTPTGLWEGITSSVDNRSEVVNKFTNFESCTFQFLPPLSLTAAKQVKLATDPDTRYASALGTRGKIGDEIDYRWRFKNNSLAAIEDLMVIDVLPYEGDHAIVSSSSGEYTSRGSKFSTPLQSVEANEKFDFYYSSDSVKDTLEENKQVNWQENVDDPSQVTMIKAVLKDGEKIAVDEVCSIVTHHQIENNDSIKDGEKAFNSFAYSVNNGKSFIEALKAEVSVNYPKKDVLVKKVDRKDDSILLANVSFDLYLDEDETSEGELVEEGLLTNKKGELLLRNLLVGKNYYLLEKSAPDPYVVNDKKISFTVSDQSEDQVLVIKNGKEKIDIPVSKLWEDQDNKDGKRPESVKIKLLADGIETDRELILNEDNDWTGTFTDLAKYNEEDEETIYSVKEEGEVDQIAHFDDVWYKVNVAGSMEDGFTITNKKKKSGKPVPGSTRKIEVKKEWLDSDGKSISPPVKSIKVELYEDGKATGKKKTLEAKNNWTASFKDLPRTRKSDGMLIDYKVKELGARNNQIKLSGDYYKVDIKGSLKEGFTIINRKLEKPDEDMGFGLFDKFKTSRNSDFPHQTKLSEKSLGQYKPEEEPEKYKLSNKVLPKFVSRIEGNPSTGAVAGFNFVPLLGFASLLFITRKRKDK